MAAERLLTLVSDECLLASVGKSRMGTTSSRSAWWRRGLGRTTQENHAGQATGRCSMLPLVANVLPETLINKYYFRRAVFFSGLFSCLSTPVPQALTVHQLGC